MHALLSKSRHGEQRRVSAYFVKEALHPTGPSLRVPQKVSVWQSHDSQLPKIKLEFELRRGTLCVHSGLKFTITSTRNKGLQPPDTRTLSLSLSFPRSLLVPRDLFRSRVRSVRPSVKFDATNHDERTNADDAAMSEERPRFGSEASIPFGAEQPSKWPQAK